MSGTSGLLDPHEVCRAQGANRHRLSPLRLVLMLTAAALLGSACSDSVETASFEPIDSSFELQDTVTTLPPDVVGPEPGAGPAGGGGEGAHGWKCTYGGGAWWIIIFCGKKQDCRDKRFVWLWEKKGKIFAREGRMEGPRRPEPSLTILARDCTHRSVLCNLSP